MKHAARTVRYHGCTISARLDESESWTADIHDVEGNLVAVEGPCESCPEVIAAARRTIDERTHSLPPITEQDVREALSQLRRKS